MTNVLGPQKTINRLLNLFLMLLSLILAALMFGCEEEEEFGDIENTWVGDQYTLDLYADGIPIAVYSETNTEFDAELVFMEDGTLLVTQDGIQTEGSWEWVTINKKISITADFGISYVDETEIFDVKLLTDSRLVLYLEKSGTIQDPETMDEYSGTAKLKLDFLIAI